MRLLIFLSLFLGIALLCIGVALLSLAIVATVGSNVTTACALCNPRFDSIRFMTACGYGN